MTNSTTIANKEVLEDLGELGVAKGDDSEFLLGTRDSRCSHLLLIGAKDFKALS